MSTDRTGTEQPVAELREIVLVPSDRVRSLERVTRRLGHDLRNPISAILHFTEDLSAGADPDGSLAEDVRFIELAVREALGHLGHVRDLVVRESVDPAEVDVGLLATTIVEGARDEAAPGVTIELEVSPGLPSVYADPDAVALVIANVLDNAVDAVDGEGRVTVRLDSAGDHVVEIVTTDDGRGMDVETIGRSIEPYFTTAADSRSHGVGLSLVGGVLTGHDGRLAITSAPGRGTTVRITFPGTRPEPSVTG